MTKPLNKIQFQQHKNGWKKSSLTGFSQDENGNFLPWMTYSFIEFIAPKINQNHDIFEFGSGSSTLFFATRARKVIALETNPLWFKIIKEKILAAKIKNVELILMENVRICIFRFCTDS